ncbi:hypothetical protein E2C01_018227 [Portunus trituberculatus]|uniref:Uncharacterized protein n=1 Tax=Portunus trituberculatus TaxID=210409 RepID=A0A5B7DVV4_PORTR|nr:hypothetical protein [Portunus trituberculatus]
MFHHARWRVELAMWVGLGAEHAMSLVVEGAVVGRVGAGCRGFNGSTQYINTMVVVNVDVRAINFVDIAVSNGIADATFHFLHISDASHIINILKVLVVGTCGELSTIFVVCVGSKSFFDGTVPVELVNQRQVVGETLGVEPHTLVIYRCYMSANQKQL